MLFNKEQKQGLSLEPWIISKKKTVTSYLVLCYLFSMLEVVQFCSSIASIWSRIFLCNFGNAAVSGTR